MLSVRALEADSNSDGQEERAGMKAAAMRDERERI
jgi:hypothetical protein